MDILTYLVLCCSLAGLSNSIISSVSYSAVHQTDIPIIENEELDYDNMFFDDFNNGIDYNMWYISKRVWGEVNGRTNGGVIPQNVSYNNQLDNEFVRLTARGNYYAKEEVKGVGSITDGSSTGAALILKQTTSPGRYEIRMKVAPRVGACTAFWTYTEDENGLNHEIDIELPGTVSSKTSFNNILFTNYIGNSTSQCKTLDYYLSDGEYHTFGFDWYYSKTNKLINYYVDDVLLATSTTNIPFLETRLWVGVWIPNNPDFVGNAYFDTAFMDIDYVKYIPFKNQDYISHDAYINSSQVASIDEYPSTSSCTDSINKIPNGDFEYISKKDTQYGYGLNFENSNAIVSQTNGYYSAGLSLTNSSVNTIIDSCYPNELYELSLRYKGQGNYLVEYYSSNDVKISQDNFALSTQDWDILDNIHIVCPDNCFYIKATIETENNILIDDWFLGNKQDSEASEPSYEKQDSYGITTLENAYLSNSPTWSGVHVVDFDGSGLNWTVSNSQYYTQAAPFILGCSETENPTSSLASIHFMEGKTSEETIFKEINSAVFDEIGEQHYVQAMYMNFDIEHFNDLTFYFSGYAVDPTTSWYRNIILYSVDSGTSWSVGKIQALRDSNGLSSTGIDLYQISITSSDINVSFNKIRFAYASLAFSLAGQGVRISGISINRYADITNKIDNDTNICSYNKSQQSFIATQYNNLSDIELEKFANTYRKNDASQTYLEGYNYLLQYWLSTNFNSRANNLFIRYDFIILTICLSSTSLFIYLTISNFKTKHKKKQIKNH